MRLLSLATFCLLLTCWPAASIWADSPPYPEARGRLEVLQKQLEEHPALRDDAYVRLGLAIVRRFTADGSDMAISDPPWEQLQSRELSQVLDFTEQRLAEVSKGAAVIEVARPTGGPVIAKDGALFSPTTLGKSKEIVQRPYFFSGYGFFETAAASLPEFWDFGATLIQQERGPGTTNQDGTPTPELESIRDVLKSAADNRAKVRSDAPRPRAAALVAPGARPPAP